MAKNKRPKKLTAKQKQTNDIRKCNCCNRVMLEKYFDYFPHNNPEKVKSCKFCFEERVERHIQLRPNTDPVKDKKKCPRCGEEKLLCLFNFRSPGNKTPGGFCGWCQECDGKQVKEWIKSKPKKKQKAIRRKNNKSQMTAYRRHCGTPRMRERGIKQNARSAGVKVVNITRHTIAQELKSNPRCELSGRKLPLYRKTTPFKDRGPTRRNIRGGDYSDTNTINAVPGYNCLRGLMDWNVDETIEYLKIMKKTDPELYDEIYDCVYASEVAKLLPRIHEWFEFV